MAHYSETKCESGLHRGWTTEDGIIHYLGCLNLKDRDSFLDKIPRDDKLHAGILKEKSRIAKFRERFENEGPRTEYGKLLASLKAAQTGWRRTQPTPRPRVPPPTAATAKARGVGSQSDAGSALRDSQNDVLNLDDFKANVIYFKGKRPYDHPSFQESGVFPDQKVPLSLLLKQDIDNNPLMWKCEKDMIRYFHIPANNMSWMEVSELSSSYD